MRKFYTKQLFVAMVALLCSVAATAHDFEVDGIFYNVSGDGVYVTYIGSSSGLYFGGYSGSVVIPESITYNGKNYSVTSIGRSAFEDCSALTSVTIPNSVTSIGYYAFDGCSGLTSVVIPNSVTSIGSSAFEYCTGLTSVTIPNSVTSIGSYAFYGCSGLTSILVESGNTVYDSRENCNAIIETSTNTLIAGCKNTIIPNSVTSIGQKAFNNCSGLTSITIPNSVTSIGSWAFRACSGLASVTIPNSVTSIGEGAFYYCKGLTSVTIPNSVTSIGNSAFNDCTGLTSITIPNSVTSIGRSAFRNCSSLTSVTIGNSVTSIGEGAFRNCSSLTSVTIPNSVTSIGGSAFEGCTGLTSVTIPNSVTSIGSYAFYYCSGLTSITIPNSVTSIGNSTFNGCSSLTSIVVENGNKKYDSRNNCNAIIETATNWLIKGCKNTIIPNSVTGIVSGAFYNCSGLTSIEIPESVTSIGDYAFYSCSSLKSIYLFNETPINVSRNAFSNYRATLYVPQGSLDAYKAADYWNKFTNIMEFDPTAIENIEADAPTFEVTAGGILFTAAEGKAIAIYTTSGALVEKIDCYAGEEITLDKGVYIIRVGEKAVKIKL